MSLAEQLRKEGELKGVLKGKQEKELEIAKRMLEEGLEIPVVLKVTGLSLEKIKAIKKH